MQNCLFIFQKYFLKYTKSSKTLQIYLQTAYYTLFTYYKEVHCNLNPYDRSSGRTGLLKITQSYQMKTSCLLKKLSENEKA